MRFIPDTLKHRPRFWDALIVLAGAAFGGGVFLASYPWNIVDAVAFCVIAYSCFVEPFVIVTKRIDARAPIPPVTIAFLSDFHVGPHKGKRFLRRLVAKTNALSPDVILLGGDFLYDYQSDVRLLEPLGELKAPLGVFAVMGNHDSGRDVMHGRVTLTKDRTADVMRVLSAGGIRTLRNEWIRLEKDGVPFALAGTDDAWMEAYDLGKTLADIPAGMPVILLTHNPDAVLDERALRADLILSGHTHGGQVRLPFVGSVVPIPNVLGRKHDRGTFALPKDTTLIVSHGTGESMARPRFLAAPEILRINTVS